MIETITDTLFQISLIMLLAAVGFTVFRLIKGPSLPDRIIALDLIALFLICFCGVFAGSTGQVAYLDIAVALALVVFLATVALARYTERRLVIHAGPDDAGPEDTADEAPVSASATQGKEGPP